MVKILVADDESNVRELLKSILTGEGYAIIEAADGGSAYATAVSQKPDIILLDLMMPVMNGYRVLKKLKNHSDTEPIPVIILTALRLPEDVQKGMEAGAADYITKPFSSGELLDRVRMVLSYLETGMGISRLAENFPKGAQRDLGEVPATTAAGRNNQRRNRSVTSDRVLSEAEKFLRGQFKAVREIRITNVAKNARNPQRDMWEMWGTRMMKVWGDAKARTNRQGALTSVPFQLEVYASRDGHTIGHRGTVLDNSNRPEESSGHGLSTAKLSKLAETFLKEKFKEVRKVNISYLTEASLHGESVYQLWGNAMAALNEISTVRMTKFQLRLYISRHGKVTLRRGKVWQK